MLLVSEEQITQEAEQGLSVLIIGAGLIGTSLGLALSERGYSVFLDDEASSHVLVAASLGAGAITTALEPVDADVVVVAVPPAMAGEVVAQALKDHPKATVTDVASVKSPVLDAIRVLGADLKRYVGSHPMAGSHRSGPLTARADLFVDRTWVVTVHMDVEATRVDQILNMAQAVGATVELMDPLEHDQAVAEVSHVPQILSSLMAGNLIDVTRAHLRLAGQGVRDVTRIAASDEALWTQIITSNHEAIHLQLMKLSMALADVTNHLDSPEAVSAFMKQGIEGVRSLPGKHGRTTTEYVYVVVEIPDSPGALADLFAQIGSVGVNVEDLGIEHDRRREVGYLSIAVEPDKAEALSQAIADAGWTLKP